jgi:P4 family phage/plasmid primase-like protien
MKFFKTKRECISAAKTQEEKLIANFGIKKYFIVPDYETFLEHIKSAQKKCFFEFIPESVSVKLFFDIEIFKDKSPIHYLNYNKLVDILKLLYGDEYILLESHQDDIKKSFHVIFPYVIFKSVKELKHEIHSKSELTEFVKEKIIDTSVYREGLFRTLYSSKENEQRPIVYSQDSPLKNLDLETFICNIPSSCVVNSASSVPSICSIKNGGNIVKGDNAKIEKESLGAEDVKLMIHFLKKNYNYNENDVNNIKLDRTNNCIVIGLSDKFCNNIDREHKSNHQYIIVDFFGSRQKCHDPDCKSFKKNELKYNMLSDDVSKIITSYFKVSEQDMEMLQVASTECKEYVNKFDKNVENLEYDKSLMIFKGNATDKNLIKLDGKCTNCKIEHQISNNGYCAKCIVCSSMFPENDFLSTGEKYKNLNQFWQIVNPTIIINNTTNNISNGEEIFACDISLDSSIFNNKEITEVINQILDGHKISKLSQLMKIKNDIFVYDNDNWFIFDGNVWKRDPNAVQLKKYILELTSTFNKIQQFYMGKSANEQNNNLIHNIKNLIIKINRPGFKKDIVEDCKLFFDEPRFVSKLNCKKHLVPFTNGVFDLLNKEFRPSRKEDYVLLTTDYDYHPEENNPNVYLFLEQILPNKTVRDYVLKKFAECLNGDIPNTKFLMFIGDGANGKSQLLNLMKIAFGELAEKVEVTLLTRKRNNANEANSEKIKLMNKRFAFLSEPEDGEKINISLLKELTGSEEIVARGLYQESVSFVMETKLFLACNELPEIKGEDTALWRRIRVIDFPSRFIDDPKEINEFKIDITLPSTLREDVSWRQTFMNILLMYYYMDIIEPNEVQNKTKNYRDDNNEIESWCKDNIELSPNSILELKSLCEIYFINNPRVGVKEKGKLRKQVEKYLQYHLKIDHECKNTKINGKSTQHWIGITLKS